MLLYNIVAGMAGGVGVMVSKKQDVTGGNKAWGADWD